MISDEMRRLGIGIPDAAGDLDAIFEEAAGSTEREIRHLLRDEKVDAKLRELATGLVIDFVVDASKLGAGTREMLFGINRFEHVNAPGNPFQDKVPEAWRRFGASVFFDEKTGAIFAFVNEERPQLSDAQIASFMGSEPEKIRSFRQASEFSSFMNGTLTKVADSLDAFLAACAPCDDPSPANDDYPKYE